MKLWGAIYHKEIYWRIEEAQYNIVMKAMRRTVRNIYKSMILMAILLVNWIPWNNYANF